jgi:hypothetical protein
MKDARDFTVMGMRPYVYISTWEMQRHGPMDVEVEWNRWSWFRV